MGDLLDFYRNERNLSGHTYDQVMAWDDQDWDEAHDFIQWLFPTDEVSMFVPEAPVLTREMVAEFRDDGDAMFKYRSAVDRARKFLCVGQYQEGDLGDSTVRTWWDFEHNHNVLRVSRIIRSMAIILGKAEATTLLAEAKAACWTVNDESLAYWEKNVEVVL